MAIEEKTLYNVTTKICEQKRINKKYKRMKWQIKEVKAAVGEKKMAK